MGAAYLHSQSHRRQKKVSASLSHTMDLYSDKRRNCILNCKPLNIQNGFRALSYFALALLPPREQEPTKNISYVHRQETNRKKGRAVLRTRFAPCFIV